MTREVLAKHSSTGRDGLGREGTRLPSEASAAAQFSGPWDGRVAAQLWAEFSIFPREAGIAGRKFATFAPLLPVVPLLYAIAEAAAEGHHAPGSLREDYLRSRCARIGETLRDIERQEHNAEQWTPIPHRSPGFGLHPLADVLAHFAPVKERKT